MNNNNQPLYPTDKMESAIEYLDLAISKYREGLQSQRTYNAFMEQVKQNLHMAVSDIEYAYAMIEPMPEGEPIPENEAMKPNAGAEGGRRQARSAHHNSTRRCNRSDRPRSARRRHRSKRA